MKLKLRCVEAKAVEVPIGSAFKSTDVYIGKNDKKKAKSKTVNKRVICASNAGDKGIRVNTDHKNAGDTFKITTVMSGKDKTKITVKRTDKKKKGKKKR